MDKPPGYILNEGFKYVCIPNADGTKSYYRARYGTSLVRAEDLPGMQNAIAQYEAQHQNEEAHFSLDHFDFGLEEGVEVATKKFLDALQKSGVPAYVKDSIAKLGAEKKIGFSDSKSQKLGSNSVPDSSIPNAKELEYLKAVDKMYLEMKSQHSSGQKFKKIFQRKFSRRLKRLKRAYNIDANTEAFKAIYNNYRKTNPRPKTPEKQIEVPMPTNELEPEIASSFFLGLEIASSSTLNPEIASSSSLGPSIASNSMTTASSSKLDL